MAAAYGTQTVAITSPNKLACVNNSYVAMNKYVNNDMKYNYILLLLLTLGTAAAQWLRCCATNRKVAGSIPAGVSGFFIDIKSFRSHYGPGVDSVPGVFPGGKGGRCIRLTTYHHPVPLSQALGTLTSWNPLGHSRPVTGLLFYY